MRNTQLLPDLDGKFLVAISDDHIVEDAPAVFTAVLRRQTLISGPYSPTKFENTYRMLYGKVTYNSRLMFDMGNLPVEAAARRTAFARQIYDALHESDFMHELRRFVESSTERLMGRSDYHVMEFLFHGTSHCKSFKACYNDQGSLIFSPGEAKET